MNLRNLREAMLYFDHNATTPLMAEAKAAWLDAVERFPGNPSSPHRIGSRAEKAIEDAREQLGGFLGCSPLEITWTAGATEAANTVFHHYSRTLQSDQEVWVSAIEHPCVLDAAKYHLGDRVDLIPVDRSGVVAIDWVQSELKTRRPSLVVVMAANNETGCLQPWDRVAALCREQKVDFFCDAAQWLGKLPSRGLGHCDWVCGCAHKFGGPNGVGFLKCPARGRVAPLLVGGKQEGGRRAGTENVASVLAMIKALEIREQALSGDHVRQRISWKDQFERRLQDELDGSMVLGSRVERLWNTVSAIMPATDCRQRWVVKLDRLGFAVSTGSACASGKEEPSHVLEAMGIAAEEAGRVLRFSSGWETTEEDWDRLLGGLGRVYEGLRRRVDLPADCAD